MATRETRLHKVFLVHGIQSSGEWFPDVMDVLAPHYDCHAIYRHYYRQRGVGVAKLVFKLPYLIGSLAVAVVIWALGRLGVAPGTGWFAVAVLIFGIVWSWILARRQRIASRDELKREVDAILGPGHRPHMIAHSLGSYFTGQMIRVFPSTQIRKAILVGSVLPRKFGWRQILEERAGAFEVIRNEVGRRDWVARLAGLSQAVLGLGGAGVWGFRPDELVVHDLKGAFAGCDICGFSGCQAPVRNVFITEFGHSTFSVGRGHASKLWLPFLWEIEPVEYQEFLELCEMAYRYEVDGDALKLATIERILCERSWDWTDGIPLFNYVQAQLIARHPYLTDGVYWVLENLCYRTIRGVWHVIAEASAQEARDTLSRSTRRCVYPPYAIARVTGALG